MWGGEDGAGQNEGVHHLVRGLTESEFDDFKVHWTALSVDIWKNIYNANHVLTVLFGSRPGSHMISLICSAPKKAKRSVEDNCNRYVCTITNNDDSFKMFHIPINKILKVPHSYK